MGKMLVVIVGAFLLVACGHQGDGKKKKLEKQCNVLVERYSYWLAIDELGEDAVRAGPDSPEGRRYQDVEDVYARKIANTRIKKRCIEAGWNAECAEWKNRNEARCKSVLDELKKHKLRKK